MKNSITDHEVTGGIGTYKPGLMYSTSSSGVFSEFDLLNPKGIGREDSANPYGKESGGLMKTMRLITLMHESTHYIHDLSLGACMEHDLLLDKSSALLFSGLSERDNNSILKLPLSSHSNDRSNTASIEGETLSQIHETDKYVEMFWDTLPNSVLKIHQPKAHVRTLELCRKLTGKAIQEGLALAKTQHSIINRVRTHEDFSYLSKHKKSFNLFHNGLPPIYGYARELFDNTVALLFPDGDNYVSEDWPKHYFGSLHFLMDIAFINLCDIALHIPPSELIEKYLLTKNNTLEDFCPATRFIKSINTILKANELPNYTPSDSEGYYEKLYDYIAMDNDWPLLEETNSTWKEKLSIYKDMRNESTDGYRFRVFIERDKRSMEFVSEDALVSCSLLYIPILHLTPSGFKILVSYGNLTFPYEFPTLYVYQWFKSYLPKWKDIKEEYVLENEPNNQQLLVQEMVYRSLCRSLQNSILYKDSLCCPFSTYGCNSAVAGCAKINSGDKIPNNECCMREYIEMKIKIDPSKLVWI
jgi:hypothetical protein